MSAEAYIVEAKVGYAVVSFGRIDVRTVGPTRRSAIINWLVTTANIMVYRHHNDEQVEMLWKGTKGRDHEVVAVDISVSAAPSNAVIATDQKGGAT